MNEYEEELACMAKFGLKKETKPDGRIPAKSFPVASTIKPQPEAKSNGKEEKKTSQTEEEKRAKTIIDIIRAQGSNNHNKHAGGTAKKNRRKKKVVGVKI